MVIAICLLALASLYFRSSGLLRGLERDVVFHPDSPKQIVALEHFLNGVNRWHYSHPTYDGYPYGLNSVDVWPIRPALTLAPMMSTVTHCATGDIGVDLFAMVALVMLVGYHRRPHWIWMALAGLACGLGFACKFQGILVFAMVGIYLLLALRRSWRSLLRAVAMGALSLLFLVGGVFLGSPALRRSPKSTWRDMSANMEYVKNYRASPEFLAQPLWDQVST